MLTVGQTLAAIRTLEIKVGSSLYQIRRDDDPRSAKDHAVRVLDEVQKELERLGEN